EQWYPPAGYGRADLQFIRAPPPVQQVGGQQCMPGPEGQGGDRGEPPRPQSADDAQCQPAGRHCPPVPPGQPNFLGYLALCAIGGVECRASLFRSDVIHDQTSLSCLESYGPTFLMGKSRASSSSAVRSSRSAAYLRSVGAGGKIDCPT